MPLNPQGFSGIEAHNAFNVAVSFVTNTNWQNYSGEAAMSHLVQMLGLTVQNFLSAATGIALAFAFIRGFARREAAGVGNEEEVSAERALRPGAAGLEGSDAHPIAGSATTSNAIGPA